MKPHLEAGWGFLNITTSEKKIGFLLIEIFRKLFNPQISDHQGSILGGLSRMLGFLEPS
jgi:hypothetical protein